MSTGVWVALAAVAIALALGAYRRSTDGRFRGVERTVAEHPDPQEVRTSEPSVLADTPWADQAGDRATLLQFSSAFCAPCRATRQVLAGVAAEVSGVTHVEVDAELHLDVVRRLGVLRTPTTLLLDGNGVELTRAGGVPSREQVRRVLGVGSD